MGIIRVLQLSSIVEPETRKLMDLSNDDMENDFWHGSKSGGISDGKRNHYTKSELEFNLGMEGKTISHGIWLRQWVLNDIQDFFSK